MNVVECVYGLRERKALTSKTQKGMPKEKTGKLVEIETKRKVKK